MGPDHDQNLSVSIQMLGTDYLTSIALVQLFERSGYVHLSGFSTRLADALELTKRKMPDVVLLDAGLGEDEVRAAITAIVGLANAPKVVVLSEKAGGDPTSSIEAAFRLGAAAYLVRNLALEDIAAALRIVHRGGLVNAGIVACTHASENPARILDARLQERMQQLNLRDRKIVSAVASGRTNTEIARTVNVSEATVKARLADVMQRLGLQNRVQVAVAAARAGLEESSR